MPQIRSSRAGLTIAEVLVASSVLMLLFGAISLIYYSGSQVWRKVDLRTSLLRELQVAARYIERGVEVSHPYGLTRAENALAYLSATDDDNELSFDSEGRPNWTKFVLVYIDDEDRLRQRELPLDPVKSQPPSFKDEMGVTFESFLSTMEPAGRYLTHSGKVTALALENAGNYGSLFELRIEAEQMKNSTEKEILEIRTKLSIRN
ncbi:MAG: hypothetical protein WC314_26260 [Vulcanimicrobiota bacterium]